MPRSRPPADDPHQTTRARRPMSPRSHATCLALLSLALCSPAGAADYAFALAGEVWPDDHVPGHGIALAAVDFEPWIAEGRPSIVLNTDTLRLGLSEMHLGERWRLGVGLAGEYGIAGLLTDYYVEGEAVPDRGFLASYAEAEVRVKRLFDGGAWSELALTGRRWFFDRAADTADALALPPEAWVFMPRLHLGGWGLADDAGWRARHRLFPRLRGFAAGVDLGVDLRSDSSAWGGLGAGDGRADRNDPAAAIPIARQWLRAGLPLGGRLRVEVEQQAGFGVGEDDLTRARVGGVNPYVVQVPGAPWAAWLSDRFVAGRLALPVRAFADVEIAPTAAAVWLRDPQREGADAMGLVWGAGATVDARFDRWQVDLRGGVSPSLADDLAWSAYLGVGWGTGG